MILRYIIYEIPPSNNKFIGRTNRWEYQKVKDEWHSRIQYLCNPKPPAPIEKAKVTIAYYFKDNRRRDPDNYSGKMILDGLVKSEIIKDDNFDCIDLILKKGGVDKDHPRTIIEVEYD